MKITRTIDNVVELITFPIERWGIYSNPTLAFMLKQGFTEVVSEPPTTEEIATANISRIEGEVGLLAYEKVCCHIAADEKAHWMGMADAFARQHNLWVAEFIAADIDQRMPDEVTYPPLSAEDQTLWSNLAVIQKLTAAIRTAATGIINSLYMMTDEEINALPADWVATNPLWP